jgi:glycosyltransferase involved in cell wall biosynthesis
MAQRPLLSIVVFVLNAAKTLERALTSVTRADQPPVELIVMDGGSTDGTLDIIHRYAPRVAKWRSRRDGSAAVAINEGIACASGEVIGLLPGDDWLERGALQWVTEAFAADPALAVLSCGARFMRAQPDGSMTLVKEVVDEPALRFTMHNLVRWPLTPARFIRRAFYERFGGYNSAYLISNDLDFLIKVLRARPKTRVLPRPVYNFEVHAGSRSLGGAPAMMREMLRGNLGVAEEHLRASGLTFAERAALLGLHGRASARLAWMHWRSGERGNGLHVMGRAMRRNWAFPLAVPLWAVHRALRRDRLL